MAADIIDIMSSLTLIMNEEVARLQTHQHTNDLGELVTVKRSQPDWADALEEQERERLSETLIALGKASAANVSLLERQLERSSEMMEAFAREARRLAGKRASTYCAGGGLSPLDLATPISINSHY
jgi:hypothetical protein